MLYLVEVKALCVQRVKVQILIHRQKTIGAKSAIGGMFMHELCWVLGFICGVLFTIIIVALV
jgi:hypothetical protein